MAEWIAWKCTMPDRVKLFILDEKGNRQPKQWGNGWLLQEFPWGRRILCSTVDDRMSFLLSLISAYPGPFKIAYVLEDNVGLEDAPMGRYEIKDRTLVQVEHFVSEFGDLIQFDGRHHFHVGCPDRTVVYDQHDYFLVYGDIDALQGLLIERGYRKLDYELGVHAHLMGPDVSPIRQLLDYWPWRWSGLEAPDTSAARVGKLEWFRLKVRAWRNEWRCRLRGGSDRRRD